jgi:hypothetical protein
MTTSSTTTTVEELRLSALHHATITSPSGTTPEEIITRAEAYLAFLTGQSEHDEQNGRRELVAQIISDLESAGHYAAAGHLRTRLSGLA